MTRLKITSNKTGIFNISIDDIDISHMLEKVSFDLNPNTMPIVNITLKPLEVLIDIEDINYIIKAKEKYHKKLQLLKRIKP
ncbi:MAG: hypothetical protein V3V19_11200 [Cocleimonas sp.]